MSDSNKLPAGWALPSNLRKWHYFSAGEMRSLCQSVFFGGERFDDKHDSPDNCAQCKRAWLRKNRPLKSPLIRCGVPKSTQSEGGTA